MKRIIIWVLLFNISILSCKSQSCDDFPDRFASYSEAISRIKEANFKYTDELPPGKSSWIISANYYSCDGEQGYLVFTTSRDKVYIHEKVPIRIWEEFKNAGSSGSYYDYNIKGKFRLVPLKR